MLSSAAMTTRTALSPHAAPYDIHGYPVVLDVPDRDARAAVTAIFRAFTPSPEVDRDDATRYVIAREETGQWAVWAEDTVIYRATTLPDVLVALEWHIVTALIAQRRDRFHLHGAALGTPDGAGSILILGASGSGKTTLTLALMARGFMPHTDDIILIDPQSLAPETFRRAFHVDTTTRALIEALPHPNAWDFDALPPGYFMPPQWADKSAPVRAIFFPTLHPQEPPSATALTIADAVTTLLPFSTTLDQAPAFALPTAARLTERAACYALTTGDLAKTADLIARTVGTDEAAR